MREACASEESAGGICWLDVAPYDYEDQVTSISRQGMRTNTFAGSGAQSGCGEWVAKKGRIPRVDKVVKPH